MKKNFSFLSFLVLMFAITSVGQAQNSYQPCNAIGHPLFEPAPMGKKPVTLNRLGTSPQFGEISSHTASAAYSHLKRVYTRNSARNKREIDNLLQAMGYTGMNDPNFNASRITPEYLPTGTTGWMGAYARGHKYNWSVLGRSFETFKITSLDGQCYVYIMKKCGNAFYDPSVRMLPPTTPPVAYKPEKKCVTQTINLSGKSQISKTNFISSMAPIQIVAAHGTKPEICLGITEVPVNASYDANASGSINFSKTIDICALANGQTTVNLMSPLQLGMDITEATIYLGQDGRMVMNVSEHQYKELKKLYGTCDNSSGSAMSIPAFVKDENSSEVLTSRPSGTGSGDINCKPQTITFQAKTQIADGSVTTGTQSVTVVGRHMKTGALAKGETADKYLCLGTYPMNAALAAAFNVSGTTKIMKTVEICDKTGNAPSAIDLNVPVTLDYSISNPKLNVGDSERIFINLDAHQYKILSKRFGRCCGVEGNTKCM